MLRKLDSSLDIRNYEMDKIYAFIYKEVIN